jgi:hypothetical protein
MHRGQVFALVERTAALAGTEVDPVRLCRLVEEARLVVGFEAFEEVGKLRRETRVRLVGRCPEGVPAGRRVGVDLENGVVGWDGFEGYVAVPLAGGESRLVSAVVLGAALGRDAKGP